MALSKFTNLNASVVGNDLAKNSFFVELFELSTAPNAARALVRYTLGDAGVLVPEVVASNAAWAEYADTQLPVFNVQDMILPYLDSALNAVAAPHINSNSAIDAYAGELGGRNFTASRRKMNSTRHRETNADKGKATRPLTEKEEKLIDDLFEDYGVAIEATTDSTESDDGVLYEEYVVMIHNPDRKSYDRLMQALDKLESEYDIGYWNDYRSDSGDIRDDIHFFHYPSE